MIHTKEIKCNMLNIACDDPAAFNFTIPSQFIPFN